MAWKVERMIAGKTMSIESGKVARQADGAAVVTYGETVVLVTAVARPTREEQADIEYGRRVAAALSGFDIGQSVAICERACVAVEAMEGTDAMLQRAASLVNGRRLTLVKAGRRREHMLFDVPVVGAGTIPVMVETGTTALAVEAGRTLLLDREEMLKAAEEAGVAVIGCGPALFNRNIDEGIV